MIKELEKLNDYVDGFLISVYEEQEGNVRNGKTEFLEKFRSQLASIPSNKEGEELVKLLNRSLLKAKQLPLGTTLNKQKGFEEALLVIQNKIKELFKIEDLSTGTIQHYLQDIPQIDIEGRVEMPPGDVIFSSGEFNEETEKELRKAGQMVAESLDRQSAVLKKHLENNGKLIVLSDDGYTDLDQVEEGSLNNLIQGNTKAKEKVMQMIESSISLFKKLKAARESKGRRRGGNPLDDFLGKLDGLGLDDPED